MGNQRDIKIDFLRGIAAIIVVFGHSLQQFENYEFSPIFNIIFSIQMPLFMIISGYVVIYQKRLNSFSSLKRYLLKRSVSLLLPWIVWCLIAYLVLWKDTPIIEYAKYAIFHMEDAYWFLFSLWTISIMFCVSSFFSNLVNKSGDRFFIRLVIYCAVYLTCMSLLGFLGYKKGMNFIGIKYSLYYSLFFNVGIAVATIRKSRLWDYAKSKPAYSLFLLVSVIAYMALIHTHNIMLMEDSIPNIIIRFLISVIGCLLLLLYVEELTFSNNIFEKVVIKIGGLSLELYVVHWILMFSGMIQTNHISCLSIEGFGLAILYFVLMLLLSILVIKVLSFNTILNLFFFGKKRPRMSKGMISSK